MNNDDAEREAEKTLSLLDAARKIPASPYFYSKVHTRLVQQPSEHYSLAFLFHKKMVFAVVGIIMLILINMYSFVNLLSHNSDSEKKQELLSFAKEYELVRSQNLY
jgi:hypothetical protein